MPCCVRSPWSLWSHGGGADVNELTTPCIGRCVAAARACVLMAMCMVGKREQERILKVLRSVRGGRQGGEEERPSFAGALLLWWRTSCSMRKTSLKTSWGRSPLPRVKQVMASLNSWLSRDAASQRSRMPAGKNTEAEQAACEAVWHSHAAVAAAAITQPAALLSCPLLFFQLSDASLTLSQVLGRHGRTSRHRANLEALPDDQPGQGLLHVLQLLAPVQIRLQRRGATVCKAQGLDDGHVPIRMGALEAPRSLPPSLRCAAASTRPRIFSLCLARHVDDTASIDAGMLLQLPPHNHVRKGTLARGCSAICSAQGTPHGTAPPAPFFNGLSSLAISSHHTHFRSAHHFCPLVASLLRWRSGRRSARTGLTRARCRGRRRRAATRCST